MPSGARWSDLPRNSSERRSEDADRESCRPAALQEVGAVLSGREFSIQAAFSVPPLSRPLTRRLETRCIHPALGGADFFLDIHGTKSCRICSSRERKGSRRTATATKTSRRASNRSCWRRHSNSRKYSDPVTCRQSQSRRRQQLGGEHLRLPGVYAGDAVQRESGVAGCGPRWVLNLRRSSAPTCSDPCSLCSPG